MEPQGTPLRSFEGRDFSLLATIYCPLLVRKSCSHIPILPFIKAWLYILVKAIVKQNLKIIGMATTIPCHTCCAPLPVWQILLYFQLLLSQKQYKKLRYLLILRGQINFVPESKEKQGKINTPEKKYIIWEEIM